MGAVIGLRVQSAVCSVRALEELQGGQLGANRAIFNGDILT